MNSESTPYRGALHSFAIFTACATFILIIAGALVTSNDAGLSVPDWPTSFGSLYKIPRMVGGIKFEHTHRMVAEFIGLLTIVIAIWTWRSDRRRWMKGLGIAALGTVIAQGVLGGITVLHFLPPAISSAHAALGQTFSASRSPSRSSPGEIGLSRLRSCMKMSIVPRYSRFRCFPSSSSMCNCFSEPCSAIME